MTSKRNVRRLRRILSGVTALILLTCTFSAALPQNTVETKAGFIYATGKDSFNTKLGTGDLFNPGRAGQWGYVYFGNTVSTDHVKYRVLDIAATEYGGDTLLLDCDSVVTKRQYAPSQNSWVGSEIREYLNGEYLEEAFSEAERDALYPSTKDAASAKDGSGHSYFSFSPLSDDKVFIPDAAELTSIYYGYLNTINTSNIRRKTPIEGGLFVKYWLRSKHKSVGTSVPAVDPKEGQIEPYGITDGTMGVSPAININKASLILTTKIGGVSGQPLSEYKLTISDDSLSLGITDGQSITRLGDTLTIPYTASGDINRLSLLITEGDWNADGSVLKYYIPILDGESLAGSDTVQAELPEDFDPSWKTYIMAERVSDDIMLTDYATYPVDITVPDPIIYHITCQGDGHGTASADPSEGPYKTEVTLSAESATDYEFNHWEVVSGGVSINDIYDPNSTFRIGLADVTVKAHFSLLPPPQYKITFDPNGGLSLSNNYVITGIDCKLPEEPPIPKRTGYEFKGWYSQKSGGEKITLQTVFTEDTTIYAQWKNDLANAEINLGTALTYNGSEQTQTIASVKIGDDVLTAGSDYVVAGNKGTRAGKYTLTISAAPGSEYTGIGKKDFEIARKSITPTVTITGSYTYNGQPVKPAYTIKDGSTELDTTDYKVEYKDNTNAGTGKLIFTALNGGNYTFSPKTVDFTIAKKSFAGTTEITKTYSLTEEYEESIDLATILPVDAGTVTYGAPTTSGSVGYEASPSLSGSILSYKLRAATASTSGAIKISASALNYSNSFMITINVRQQSLALFEKVRSKQEPISSKELTVGKSIALVAKVDDPTGKERYIWCSSNPNVAKVAQDGKVTTYSAGTAVISVYEETDPVDPPATAECTITVTDPVSSVTFDKSRQVLGVGEMAELSAQVLPFTAVNELEWTTFAPGVVIVCDEQGNELPGEIVGKHKVYTAARLQKVWIKGVGPGTGKVFATATHGIGTKGTCAVSVGNPVPDFTIYGKYNKTSLIAGKTLAMKVDWGDAKPKNQGLTWKIEEIDAGGHVISDGADLATVSEKGVVTGKKAGRIRVTATSTGNETKHASADLEIYVSVKAAYINTTIGTVSRSEDANPMQLKVDLVPTVAGEAITGPHGLGDTPRITYSISNKYQGSLSVDSITGVVTPCEKNVKNVPVIVRVEAADYNKVLNSRITVKETNPLKAVKISNTRLTMGVGNVEYLTSKLDPINPDGSMRVEWTSSNDNVASVDENGKVTGESVGTAMIKVTSEGLVKSKGQWVHPTATCKVTVRPSVKTVSFNNGASLESKGLGVGKFYNLKSILTLTGPGKAASSALQWTSSDPSIVSVSAKGQIRALKVKPGDEPTMVTVTATSKDKKAVGDPPSASVTFRVYSMVRSITLDKTMMTLGTQDESKYGIIGVARITPDNADNPAIEWKSFNDKVELAVADNNNPASAAGLVYKDAHGQGFTGSATATGEGVIMREGQYLFVKAMKPGKVKVVGYTTDGSGKKVVCVVTVRGEITGIGLKTSAGRLGVNDVTENDNPATTDVIEYTGNMKCGYGLSLTPVYRINDIWGNTQDQTEKSQYSAARKYTDTSLSFRSSDTNKATVDSNGKIKMKRGLDEGAQVSIYVTSSDGKYKAKYTITVVK